MQSMSMHTEHNVRKLIRSFRLEIAWGRCANRRIKIMTLSAVSEINTFYFMSETKQFVLCWSCCRWLPNGNERIKRVQMSNNFPIFGSAFDVMLFADQVCDGPAKKGVYMDEALTKTSEFYEWIYQSFQVNTNRTILSFFLFTRTEFGKFNYVLILITGIVLTSVILDSCSISFVLPVSECDLNLTPRQKGVLGAISFIGIICSSHLWGFLADTRGRRVIIQPTLAIAFVMSLLSTFTSNFYIFIALRFLNGFL